LYIYKIVNQPLPDDTHVTFITMSKSKVKGIS